MISLYLIINCPKLSAERETSLEEMVRFHLSRGEFWSSDGSGIDNSSMINHILKLINLLSNSHSCSPLRTQKKEELVFGAAFLSYKSQRLNERLNLPLASFARECNLKALTSDKCKQKEVMAATAAIERALVALLPCLPYYVNSSKSIKSSKVLFYLEDLLKYENIVSLNSSQKNKPLAPDSSSPIKEEMVKQEESKSKRNQEEEENLSDLDVDEFIRSKEEVNALRPLHDKFHLKNPKPKPKLKMK